MSFTHEQLKQMGYSLQQDGTYSKQDTFSTHPERIFNSKSKPSSGKTLPSGNETQKGSEKRLVLRITRYSRKLLDEDNLCGSKLLTDQLRYAGIIPSDAPDKLKIINDQVKVKYETEERTEVEIKEL